MAEIRRTDTDIPVFVSIDPHAEVSTWRPHSLHGSEGESMQIDISLIYERTVLPA